MNERPVWSAEHLNLTIGRQIIFNDAGIAVGEGERLALIGRNGCGKSTLLRIAAGLEKPSSGEISIGKVFRIAYMPQDPVIEGEGTIGEVVAQGLHYFRQLLADYERLAPGSAERARYEQQLDYHQAWNPDNKLAAMLDRLTLAPQRPVSTLSGGETRRVLLARAIIAEPDLLLLDEPTNHLDVETVSWIENFLAGYRGTCLFVTHDRFFLDRIATRIVELSDGGFFSCTGSYADFLAAKAAQEYAEESEAAKRAKFLRLEVEWVRRSPKARLRRNLGRVRRFEELSAIEGPKRIGDVELIIPRPARLGNKIVELKNVSYSVAGKKLIDGFSCEFPAGSKTGIIGANGIGKTTLLKLMTGLLRPDSGEVAIADTVEFNYIDQKRIELDPEKTVAESVAGESDTVYLGDGKISVWGYLKRFLFEDERINTVVRRLSGGEKARLLLAMVLKRGGNFLILDEPTNDLDLPTLRVLEEALIHFPAPVVVVSHDRYFLNRVCNRILSFEEDGKVRLQLGDYDTYAAKREEREANAVKTAAPAPVPAAAAAPVKRSKLSYKEERELEGMEQAVTEVEEKISALETEFTAPDFYQTRAKEAPVFQRKIAELRAEAERLYARWEELETKKAELAAGK